MENKSKGAGDFIAIIILLLMCAIILLGVIDSDNNARGLYTTTNKLISEEVEYIESIIAKNTEDLIVNNQMEIAIWRNELKKELSSYGFENVNITAIPYYFDSDKEVDYVDIKIQLEGRKQHNFDVVIPLK